MAQDIPDLTGWSDTDLGALAKAVSKESGRRDTLASLPVYIEELAGQYREALGRTTGAAWAQPAGAHDAYPEGAVVTHAGQSWRSEIPANVWSPGTYGWVVDEDAETAPPPDAPAWEPGITYQGGDLVAYDGTVYKVVQGHTSAAHWLPPVVPSLYVPA